MYPLLKMDGRIKAAYTLDQTKIFSCVTWKWQMKRAYCTRQKIFADITK